MSPSEATREFHEAFNVPVRLYPDMNVPEKQLRKKLISEEYDEVMAAFYSGDLSNLAKELVDLVYIVYGTAHAMGIPLDEVFEEVHRSNMSKLDDNGQPVLREDGKILKSSNYREADIDSIISDAKAHAERHDLV